MKLFVSIFAAIGRLLLLLASAAFITFLSLFVIGAYLATWPVLRLSPKDRRITALTGLGTAVLTAVRAYAPEPKPDDGTAEERYLQSDEAKYAHQAGYEAGYRDALADRKDSPETTTASDS